MLHLYLTMMLENEKEKNKHLKIDNQRLKDLLQSKKENAYLIKYLTEQKELTNEESVSEPSDPDIDSYNTVPDVLKYDKNE